MKNASNNKQAKIDRKIAAIHKNCRFVSFCLKLAQLKNKKTFSVGSGNNMGSDSFK